MLEPPLSGASPLKRALLQIAIGYGAAVVTYVLGRLFDTGEVWNADGQLLDSERLAPASAVAGVSCLRSTHQLDADQQNPMI